LSRKRFVGIKCFFFTINSYIFDIIFARLGGTGGVAAAVATTGGEIATASGEASVLKPGAAVVVVVVVAAVEAVVPLVESFVVLNPNIIKFLLICKFDNFFFTRKSFSIMSIYI
tara:strand:- start:3552 stop:3893 length:342 start_codon:yes stop_codon:yes gene_type:complete